MDKQEFSPPYLFPGMNELIASGRVPSVLEIANEFIRQANAANRPLSNMQLQKMVYIAHGYSLAILGRPLFHEAVIAGPYGPVVPVLYDALRMYGAGLVTHLIVSPKRTTARPTIKQRLGRVLWLCGCKLFKSWREEAERESLALAYSRTER